MFYLFICYSVLIDEINEYDKKQKEIINDANLSSNRLKDYKKTSLLKSVNIFEEFLRSLENTWKGSIIKQSGMLKLEPKSIQLINKILIFTH